MKNDKESIIYTVNHYTRFQHALTDEVKKNIITGLTEDFKDRIKQIEFGESDITSHPHLLIVLDTESFYINFELRPYFM